MTDIFLSYSREDQAIARRFAEAFGREGLSVWWDQSLNPGEAFDKVTERALEEAKAVVVLWSKKSVDSRWVRAEATQASSNGTLVPVMIEACKRPIMFELTHTADLSHWKGNPDDAAWQSYVAGVRRLVKKDGSAVTAAAAPAGHSKGFGWKAVALAAALLLVLVACFWMLGRRSSKEVTPAASREVTLAVLPFANLSSDPEQEYFSDGLTEEILNQLAQIKDLAVTGRTSSFSFKGKNEDLRTIAEKLGVANLLEGSIRKDGNQLRITAQLINGKSGTHMWSKTYARESKDIFTVQEDIAKDVAQALSIKLDVGDMSRARGGTTNLEAYEKYLRARAAFARFDIVQADLYFHEAVALDPNFLDAWYWLHRITGPGREKITGRLEALAPGSWPARFARSEDLYAAGKYSEAEASIEAVQAAGPQLGVDPTEYRVVKGFFLMGVGRFKEAYLLLQPLIKADPLAIASSGLLEAQLLAMGRRDEAQAEHERSKSLVGYRSETELYYAMTDRNPNPVAIKAALGKRMEQNSSVRPLLQSVIDRLADPVAVRAVLHQAFDDPATQDALHTEAILEVAGLFGDKALAAAALKRMIVDLKTYPPTLGGIWGPYGAGVRTDPRFKDVVRAMGLDAYWRSSGHWSDFCEPVGTDDFECH